MKNTVRADFSAPARIIADPTYLEPFLRRKLALTSLLLLRVLAAHIAVLPMAVHTSIGFVSSARERFWHGRTRVS